jgi:hypothetical protein
MSTSHLYHQLKQMTEEQRRSLIDSQIDPWLFINAAKEFNVLRHNGTFISWSKREFSDQPRAIFWKGFIDPFLEDFILKTLGWTARQCMENDLPLDKHMAEASEILKELVVVIYERMAFVDQKLRHSEIKDVSNEISRKHRFIETGINPNKEPATSASEVDSGPALTFIRESDYWSIGIREIKRIKHMAGLTYLQFLLTHPGKSYSCHSLQHMESQTDDAMGRIFDIDRDYIAPPPEAVDDGAKKMKQEMAEMQRDIATAETEQQLDVGLLKETLDTKAKLYNSLYDRSGRPLDSSSPDTKARKNVGNALTRAKNKIIKELPELKSLLAKDIKGGHTLTYIPAGLPVETVISHTKD